MVVIKFERSPSKKGEHPDDYIFKIPRNYIRNELINPNKTYWVICEEIKKPKEIQKKTKNNTAPDKNNKKESKGTIDMDKIFLRGLEK